jgi:hypothetical protein
LWLQVLQLLALAQVHHLQSQLLLLLGLTASQLLLWHRLQLQELVQGLLLCLLQLRACYLLH